MGRNVGDQRAARRPQPGDNPQSTPRKLSVRRQLSLRRPDPSPPRDLHLTSLSISRAPQPKCSVSPSCGSPLISHICIAEQCTHRNFSLLATAYNLTVAPSPVIPQRRDHHELKFLPLVRDESTPHPSLGRSVGLQCQPEIKYLDERTFKQSSWGINPSEEPECW